MGVLLEYGYSGPELGEDVRSPGKGSLVQSVHARERYSG
jgi:hypothetical protein